MMFAVNADEKAVLDQISRFCDNVIGPEAAQMDAPDTLASCHLEAMASMGLLGMNLPVDAGGIGLSGPALYVAVEMIAAACGSTASMLTAHFLATDAIHLGGDTTIQERFLPDAAIGKALGAFALTEPSAGSNPADMTTQWSHEAGSYRLKGEKCFISNAGLADFIVVFAKANDSAGKISAFVVEPNKTDGVHITGPEQTMGLRGGPIYSIGVDCLVPAENRVGEEGSGFKTAMRVLDNGRIEVAAQATGIAAAALQAAIDHSRERSVGGHPIADFQGLQWMLADSATMLAAARSLASRAASLRGTGQRYSHEAAMAKLFASEAAWKVADTALQIHGGSGYTQGLPLERYMRDLRIFRIYEGSSEVQRNIIARDMLGRVYDKSDLITYTEAQEHA